MLTTYTQTQFLTAPAQAAEIADEAPGSYSIVLTGWLEMALAVAAGSYQRSLILGHEALSGATLRGRAKKWSGRYADSARGLKGRLDDAGIPWCEARRRRGGRRMLVIGAESVEQLPESTQRWLGIEVAA